MRNPAIGMPPERVPRTVDEEIAWLNENYNLSRPLMKESLLIALGQRIKRVPQAEKEHWKQVMNELKNIQSGKTS